MLEGQFWGLWGEDITERVPGSSAHYCGAGRFAKTDAEFTISKGSWKTFLVAKSVVVYIFKF